MQIPRHLGLNVHNVDVKATRELVNQTNQAEKRLMGGLEGREKDEG